MGPAGSRTLDALSPGQGNSLLYTQRLALVVHSGGHLPRNITFLH